MLLIEYTCDLNALYYKYFVLATITATIPYLVQTTFIAYTPTCCCPLGSSVSASEASCHPNPATSARTDLDAWLAKVAQDDGVRNIPFAHENHWRVQSDTL